MDASVRCRVRMFKMLTESMYIEGCRRTRSSMDDSLTFQASVIDRD